MSQTTNLGHGVIYNFSSQPIQQNVIPDHNVVEYL